MERESIATITITKNSKPKIVNSVVYGSKSKNSNIFTPKDNISNTVTEELRKQYGK